MARKLKNSTSFGIGELPNPPEPLEKWFARLFLHLGDVLGWGLGEVGEAVAAAEADHELLGRVDVLAADRAFLVIRPLDLGDVLVRGLGESGETGGQTAAEQFALADASLSDAVAFDANKYSEDTTFVAV